MSLKAKFIKKAIENEKFEYCNTSKALACVEIANDHAVKFARWILANPWMFNDGKSMEMAVKQFNEL